MRELKFRMWDKVNNKFIDPFRFEWNDYYKTTGMVLLDLNGKVRIADYSSGNGDNSASSVYSEINNPDNYVVQQYTGLTDKNGKEIYEGDIIHLKFGELNANLVVKWDKYMGLKYHNGGWTSLVHVDTHGEVIGNIFENPELPN